MNTPLSRAAMVVVVGSALLGGCKPYESGIWLLEVPSDDFECTTSISENFNLADPPQDTEATLEWQYNFTSESSPGLIYIQIEYGRGDEVFLLLGGGSDGFGSLTYPGTETENGLKFSWENFTDTMDETLHSSGYVYRETVNAKVTNEITMAKNDDNGLDVSWEIKSNETRGFEESDLWAESVGMPTGSISSAVDNEGLVGTFPIGAANRNAEADCAAQNCLLAVSDDCAAKIASKAQFVGFKEDSAFDHAEAYGQPAGAP